MGCRLGKPDPDYVEGLEVFRRYDFVAVRGRGATSQVHEAADKLTGQSFAVKCIVKTEEARLLGRPHSEKWAERKWGILEHPNVCRLHGTFQDSQLQYFVMELCEGGTLFEKLEEEIVLEENDAGRIAWQMMSAAAHLHDKAICHRDLKPESWLMSDHSQQAKVKLISFGLAEVCEDGEELTQPCGTLHYLAPEVLRGRYTKSADLWTLGVVIFLSLYAAYPFDGESCATVMQSILVSEPDWSDSCYALSQEARNLLRQLLVKEPSARLSASAALRHEWFKARARPSSSESSDRKGARKSLHRGLSFPPAGTQSASGAVNLGPRKSFMVNKDLVKTWGQSDVTVKLGELTGGRAALSGLALCEPSQASSDASLEEGVSWPCSPTSEAASSGAVCQRPLLLCVPAGPID